VWLARSVLWCRFGDGISGVRDFVVYVCRLKENAVIEIGGCENHLLKSLRHCVGIGGSLRGGRIGLIHYIDLTPILCTVVSL
jgi:hypothetical protein